MTKRLLKLMLLCCILITFCCQTMTLHAVSDKFTIFDTVFDHVTTKNNLLNMNRKQIEIKAKKHTLHVVAPYGEFTDPNAKWATEFDKKVNSGYFSDYYVRMTLDGQKVYCIQPLSMIIDQTSDYEEIDFGGYINDATVRMDIGYISALGFGYQGDQSDEMDYATQIRIWQRLYEWKPNEYPKVMRIHDDIQQKINLINKRFSSMKQQVSFHDKTLSFKGIGESYAITIKDTTNTFANYVNGSCDDGIHFERVKDNSKAANSLKVWLTKPVTKGTLTFHAFYSDAEVATPVIYQSDSSQDLMNLHKAQPTKLKLNVSLAKGSIKISKQDEDGSYIPNVQFQVAYDQAMKDTIGTFTTNEQGIVVIDQITPGYVYVKEVRVPQHLVIDKSVHKIQIVGAETASYQAVNSIVKGRLRIRKIDKDSKKQLANAVYAIYDRNHKEIERLTTNAFGEAESSDLRYGTYTLKEVIAPDHYVLDPKAYTIHITKHEQVVSIQRENKQIKGILRVKKEGEVLISADKDAQGQINFHYEKRGIPGTVFGIYAKEQIVSPDDPSNVLFQRDDLIDKIISNDKGIAESKTLSLGEYYVKELEAPLGYVISNEIKNVSLTSQGQRKPLVFKNLGSVFNQRKKVTIYAVKEDKTSHQLLEGAQISLFANKDIYNVDHELIVNKGTRLQSIMTQANSETAFTIDLPMDTSSTLESNYDNHMFYMKETQAPQGYINHTNQIYYVDTHDVTTNQNKYRYSYTFVNEKTRMMISKLDANSRQPVSGAVFKLYTKKDHQLVDEWTSNQQAHIIRGLIEGQQYLLEEIRAPKGYERVKQQVFTMKNDMQLTITNKKMIIETGDQHEQRLYIFVSVLFIAGFLGLWFLKKAKD